MGIEFLSTDINSGNIVPCKHASGSVLVLVSTSSPCGGGKKQYIHTAQNVQYIENTIGDV